ncbi:thioesterase [Staphylococcus succinus]|nr:thioesterase [Staphylococcus succinus]
MDYLQFQYQAIVKSEWVDHNGHMNDAEYHRVFSDATDAWLAYLGLDKGNIRKMQYTIYTLENHVMYLKEIKVKEAINVHVSIYDYDAKRLHVFMVLRDENQERCATYEVMLMGINTAINKADAFPSVLKDNIEDYAKITLINEKPKELGHPIGINHK